MINTAATQVPSLALPPFNLQSSRLLEAFRLYYIAPRTLIPCQIAVDADGGVHI
jgi:hypothetical protein